ncbi:hypothetical protein [Halpernia sp.]
MENIRKSIVAKFNESGTAFIVVMTFSRKTATIKSRDFSIK